MRFGMKSFTVGLTATVALSVTGPAYANGATRHHHRHVVVRVHTTAPAVVYAPVYRYVPGYAYYVPTRVFRCYPARQMVEDQVGLVVGYVPLGTCG
jgi:hypothetical protein